MHPKGRHQDIHGGCADVALMENAAAILIEENGEEPGVRLKKS